MRTCPACGFENAEEGKACSLCGASALAVTLEASAPQDPTLAYPAGFKPATSPRSMSEGNVFGGRYRLEGLLGRGGMGEVYRALDLQSKTAVALKVLRAGTEDDPQRVDRFRREIGLLSRVRHPAVLAILDWGLLDGQVYFASELIDGMDLKTAVQTRGPMDPADAAALLADLADALGVAHAQGVVHRDVKPNNVMLTRDGAVKLLDFGLARGGPGDMASLTKTGMILGTPGYMSPEQFDGVRVDARSDVYSLGIVLFELLTGRLPFMATTPVGLAVKHKTEPPPSLRAVRPDVPAWLERVCLRCLEKDPEARYATAAALAAELRKPHPERSRRRLASGDLEVEDDAWALRLDAREPHAGWTPGMALSYGGRYYKLVTVVPADGGGRWSYCFTGWPESEVFRRLVDYDSDCAQPPAAPPAAGLGDRFKGWFRP